MKKQTIQNILNNILLISIFVLVIVYIYFIFLKKSTEISENYTNHRDIIVKNNFYDISRNSTILNSSEVSSSNVVGNKVGSVNLCIYESDGSKITDVECITSGEINNALNLPKARRETVCIDEECIDIKDVKFLKGDTHFQLRSFKTDPPNKDNYLSGLCVGSDPTALISCSGQPYVNNDALFLKRLVVKDCYTNGAETQDTKFKLDTSNLNLQSLRRLGINDFQEPAALEGIENTNSEPQH